MSRATVPWLFQQPRKPRRKRCVICNELTHHTLWRTYYLPKSDKYVDGIHCEACDVKQDAVWKEEIEWQDKKLTE